MDIEGQYWTERRNSGNEGEILDTEGNIGQRGKYWTERGKDWTGRRNSGQRGEIMDRERKYWIEREILNIKGKY